MIHHQYQDILFHMPLDEPLQIILFESLVAFEFGIVHCAVMFLEHYGPYQLV